MSAKPDPNMSFEDWLATKKSRLASFETAVLRFERDKNHHRSVLDDNYEELFLCEESWDAWFSRNSSDWFEGPQ